MGVFGQWDNGAIEFGKNGQIQQQGSSSASIAPPSGGPNADETSDASDTSQITGGDTPQSQLTKTSGTSGTWDHDPGPIQNFSGQYPGVTNDWQQNNHYLYLEDGGEVPQEEGSMVDPMQILAWGRKQAGIPDPGQQSEPSFGAGGVIPEEGAAATDDGNQPVNPEEVVGYLSGKGAMSQELAAALDQTTDPEGQMNPSERLSAALGKLPPKDAFSRLQLARMMWNGNMGAAAAAAGKGDMQRANMHVQEAMNHVPRKPQQQMAMADGGAVDVSNPTLKMEDAQSFDKGGGVEEEVIPPESSETEGFTPPESSETEGVIPEEPKPRGFREKLGDAIGMRGKQGQKQVYDEGVEGWKQGFEQPPEEQDPYAGKVLSPEWIKKLLAGGYDKAVEVANVAKNALGKAIDYTSSNASFIRGKPTAEPQVSAPESSETEGVIPEQPAKVPPETPQPGTPLQPQSNTPGFMRNLIQPGGPSMGFTGRPQQSAQQPRPRPQQAPTRQPLDVLDERNFKMRRDINGVQKYDYGDPVYPFGRPIRDQIRNYPDRQRMQQPSYGNRQPPQPQAGGQPRGLNSLVDRNGSVDLNRWNPSMGQLLPTTQRRGEAPEQPRTTRPNDQYSGHIIENGRMRPASDDEFAKMQPKVADQGLGTKKDEAGEMRTTLTKEANEAFKGDPAKVLRYVTDGMKHFTDMKKAETNQAGATNRAGIRSDTQKGIAADRVTSAEKIAEMRATMAIVSGNQKLHQAIVTNSMTNAPSKKPEERIKIANELGAAYKVDPRKVHDLMTDPSSPVNQRQGGNVQPQQPAQQPQQSRSLPDIVKDGITYKAGPDGKYRKVQ